MPEKLSEQTDFFPKLDKPADVAEKRSDTEKPPRRLFDRRKIFGSNYVPPADEELPKSVESAIKEMSHPKPKHLSRAWEDLHGRED